MTSKKKILVLLRGQPRCNANLYRKNLEALDTWDADVDVVMDAVTDMYTHVSLDSKTSITYQAHTYITDASHKSSDTIAENVRIANEYPTKTKIEIKRLRKLKDILPRVDLLQNNKLIHRMKSTYLLIYMEYVLITKTLYHSFR